MTACRFCLYCLIQIITLFSNQLRSNMFTHCKPIRAYLVFSLQLGGPRFWTNEISWWVELHSVTLAEREMKRPMYSKSLSDCCW